MVIFLPFSIFCTELEPWFGPDLLFQTHLKYLWQNYQKIATGDSSESLHANDNFFTLGALLPYHEWSGELELTYADTRHRSMGWDNVRLTGRYLWLNDVNGFDPFSLVTGMTITQASKQAVRDIGSFHHGKIEAEAFVSVGKENPVENFWSSRWWGVLGIGTADIGYPWLRTEAVWEKNWFERQQLRLRALALVGFGHENLHRCHFRGYGPIAHRSVDLAARYSYFFECSGTISLEYCRRVFAYNFPKNANQVVISFIYPLGM